MPITTPKWLPKGSVPKTSGWVSPKGEILKKQKISADEIAEWYASKEPKMEEKHHHVEESHEEESKIEMLVEAPSFQTKLKKRQIKHYYQEAKEDNEGTDDL